MAEPSEKTFRHIVPTGLSGPAVHVPDWSVDSHRKTSSPRRLHMRPIQWHLKNNWRVPEKVIPIPKSLHPHLQWCLQEDRVLSGQPLHPIKHALQIFTDASKEGWGAHLNERTARGSWSIPESKLHINYLELKAVLLALRVQRSLYRPDSTGGNRQHYRCLLHKEGGRHEVGPTLCPSLENPDLVYQTPSNTQSPTHPRPTKCSSRQTIPPGSDHSNRMVPSSRGFLGNMLPVAPAQHRSICHKVQQQTTSICVACTRSPSHCGGRPQSTLGGSGRLCLPTNSLTGQSGGEVTGFSLQENHCIPDAKRGYYGFIIVVVRALVRVRVRRDFLLATYSPHFFPDFFHIWQVT